MKVVQLFKIYWPDNGGGIATTMQKIAEGLEDIENKIVVSYQNKGKKTKEEKNGNLTVIRCRQYGEVASTPLSIDFFKYLKKIEKDDVVIYHFPYPLVDFAIRLGMIKGTIIVWWHCDVEKKSVLMKPYSRLIKNTVKQADKILVGAQKIIDNSIYLRDNRKKCEIIPFCVDDSYFEEGSQFCKEGETRHNCVNILFVGRLVWYKGVDILLKAFSNMTYPNRKLVIVGDGPLKNELENEKKFLGLSGVTFTGRVSEERKMQLLKECDFFVLPSVSKAEAFALVQLEAMAFGKPVINTNLPSGVPEVSIHGITGLTVEPSNVEQLAKAMDELSFNSEIRMKYGNNAREMVETKYSKEGFTSNVRKVLYEVKYEGDKTDGTKKNT